MIPSAKYFNFFHFIITAMTLITTTRQHRGQEKPVQEKVFVFPEFDYIESPKNEIAWREWEAACEQTPVCLGIVNLEKTKCVRKCISPSCYNDIYAFDELEEGEIDIRFHSYKGCFNTRIARKRI